MRHRSRHSRTAVLARLAAVAAALLLAACDGPAPSPSDGGGPKVDFTIGGLAFHASGGVAVKAAYGYTLYLSNQVDTCQAVGFTPVNPLVLLTVDAAPTASGLESATVVAPKVTPAPGEATAKLTRSVQGNVTDSFLASGGSVTWLTNADGSVTLQAIDLAFAGTSDKLTTGGLLLSACTP